MKGNEGYVPVEDEPRLFYCIAGSGPNAVVIPGAHNLAADLGSLAQGRTLIFYDQRGRGASDPIADESLIWTDYEVRDLEAIRQHFGLEKMSLIGWSYLGGVTALYAREYAAHVSRLVLMCPIPSRSPAPYDNQEAEAWERAEARIAPASIKRLEQMKQAGLETANPVAYCRERNKVYFPRQMGTPEALAKMHSDPCIFPNEWPQNLSEHWRKHFPSSSQERDWRSRLASVQVPTLVIHGTEDLIPLEASREWVTTLANARLLIIPGSGHFPHLEAPEVYFSAVETFLSGEWPAGASSIRVVT